MNYTEAKAIRDRLESECRIASEVLDRYPRLANGLVPDEMKTEEYQTHKAAYASAFLALQKFNASFVRVFKADIQAERRQR